MIIWDKGVQTWESLFTDIAVRRGMVSASKMAPRNSDLLGVMSLYSLLSSESDLPVRLTKSFQG